MSIRGLPVNVESTNLSRDNLSREIGRITSALEALDWREPAAPYRPARRWSPYDDNTTTIIHIIIMIMIIITFMIIIAVMIITRRWSPDLSATSQRRCNSEYYHDYYL